MSNAEIINKLKAIMRQSEQARINSKEKTYAYKDGFMCSKIEHLIEMLEEKVEA